MNSFTLFILEGNIRGRHTFFHTITQSFLFVLLLCKGIPSGFTAQNITEDFPLGSKSNIDRIKKSLIDKEIIYIEKQGVFLADCVFELWFKKEMM